MENSNGEKTETVPEFKGRNLEEAIAHAEHKLKTLRQDFNYEIVTEKTKLFGLSKVIVIRAWLKAPAGENKVADFLEKLMTVFPLELEYEIKRRDGITFVVFGGSDKQNLLWKDGALLLALQHVLNKIGDEKVQVDCEFFRKRKEKKLRDYALQVARQVHQSGRNEILDLMNPYERRIIHLAANQVNGVTIDTAFAWSADTDGFGSIDENGLFTATAWGRGFVYAGVGEIAGKGHVVVDTSGRGMAIGSFKLRISPLDTAVIVDGNGTVVEP